MEYVTIEGKRKKVISRIDNFMVKVKEKGYKRLAIFNGSTYIYIRERPRYKMEKLKYECIEKLLGEYCRLVANSPKQQTDEEILKEKEILNYFEKLNGRIINLEKEIYNLRRNIKC